VVSLVSAWRKSLDLKGKTGVPRVKNMGKRNPESGQEALDYVKTLPVKKQMGEYTRDYQYKVVAIDYTHANMHGWSDVTPFEIVRVVSPKTIEVRAMIAEQNESFKPEIIPGGFAGHCVNQGQQKWNYKSAPEGMVLRARLRKDGNFHSNFGKHVLSTEPRKFYDYNF
jgi:hypothetical protein